MNTVKSILSKITIEHLWAITVIAGIITFLNTHPIRPHDFWWHLAIGRDIVTSGSIPLVDTYSFTRAGVPYLSYHQFWLMEVLLFLVFAAGGPVLIVLMQTLIISLAYLLLLRVCLRVSSNWRSAAFTLIFAAALGLGNWNVRPQTVAFLFGVLVLTGIVEFRMTQKRGWIVLFPLIMALWVNSHGSFPIGLVLIGIWFAAESLKLAFSRIRKKDFANKNWSPALVSFVLALLSCVVNPRGLGFIQYLSTMAGNSIVQNLIPEWMPPDFNSLEGLLFFTAFMGSVLLLFISPKRPSVEQILTFLIFGILGLMYIRGSIWYGIAMAPVVSDHLALLLNQVGVKPAGIPDQRSRRLNLIFGFSMIALVFASLPWFKTYWPVVQEKKGLIAVETPVEATEFLYEAHLPPRIFHDMAFGSYLIWQAQPEYKVFVDSRVELYPAAIWGDYFTIGSAVTGWDEKLDFYGINTLMLEPENQSGLIEAAMKSTDWEMVYQDQAAVVFTRR